MGYKSVVQAIQVAILLATFVSPIPANQIQALLDLYASTNGPSWIAAYQTGWSTNANDPCAPPQWSGVICTAGALTSIMLGYGNLSGPLPASIGNLTDLKILDFNQNQLTGSIPPQIGLLTNLQTLYLFFNQLSGSIPSTLGNLGQLLQLKLFANSLIGSIPPQLGSLTNLRILFLYNNQLSGPIPDTLGNLSQLLQLQLFQNQLSGAIPSSLGLLPNIYSLALHLNQLNGTIPRQLGNLTKLQTLYLCNNQLSGPIPSTLGNLVQLTQLDLSVNQLTGAIPIQLMYLTQMQNLKLHQNQLSGSIPLQLGNLTSLQLLYLSGNQLGGLIPDIFGNCSQLQQLILYTNQLNGTIPSSLGLLTNLVNLQLQNNLLTGVIPVQLGNLTSIQLLYLCYNQLSGSLPTILGNLIQLQQLDLSVNQLNGTIPTQFQYLTSLQNLRLNQNLLTGSIPSQLGDLTNLHALYLFANLLSGPIPNILGNFTQLQELALSANQFSGTIPSSLGLLTNLWNLQLSANQFSGTIPSQLGNLTKLQFLYLDNNQLSGAIPSTLGNLTLIQQLFLHANQINGTIPSFFGSYTSLNFLQLQQNQLTGTIPPGLGTLPNLQLLNISNNLLNGFIPSSVCTKAFSSCVLINNTGLWTNQTCSACSILPQRLTVAFSNINVTSGVQTIMSNSLLWVTDSQTSQPVTVDFTQIPAAVGQFYMGSQAIGNTNMTAIAASLVSFQTQTQNNVTVYITPNTADGATMGVYPFRINFLNFSSPSINIGSIQFWNYGSSISLQPFISVSHNVAAASQISFNASNGFINFQKPNSPVTNFLQSEINQNLISVTMPLSFAGLWQSQLNFSIGLYTFRTNLTVMTAPVRSGFQLYSTNLLLSSPTVSSVTVTQGNIISVGGSSFNNGSFYNSISINGTLCPAINISYTQIYCVMLSPLPPDMTYNISVAVFNAFSTTSIATTFSTTSNSNSSPPTRNLIVVIGALIGSFACLALVGFMFYKLRIKYSIQHNKGKDIEHQDITIARQAAWAYTQMSNMTFIPQISTLFAENNGLDLPGFMRHPWESVRLISTLGRGASAIIYSAEILLQPLKASLNITSTVAVKIFNSSASLHDLRQEVAILSKLMRCPYVVMLYGYIEETEHMGIIMRRYPYDLSHLIHSQGAFNFNLAAWMNIYQDVLRGLLALHTLNVAHLDIKPSNILVESVYRKSIATNFLAVLSDFGLSQHFQEKNVAGWVSSKTKGVSFPYADPETLKTIELGTISYLELNRDQAFNRDKYAVAITGYEIICQLHPWEHRTKEQIIRYVVHLQQRPLWDPKFTDSDFFRDHIEGFWAQDGNQRSSLESVLCSFEEHHV